MICNLEQNIVDICHNDYKYFFCKPNVQGIALGYKYTNGINTMENCIHVFVYKKIAANYLPANGLIPTSYKGIKTDVIETGEFVAGSNSDLGDIPHYSPSNDGPYIQRIRPISPGYCMSIDMSTLTNTLTGTFGYIVLDTIQLPNTYCMLSVNKTFADFNRVTEGQRIIQPSFNFGGRAPQDVVGNLLRYVPIKFTPNIPNSIQDFNRVDCAVAIYNNEQEIQLLDPHIPVIGIPRGVAFPSRNLPIQWTGCLSGNQKGIVNSLSATLKIRYQNNQFAWFKDIFVASGTCEFQDFGALVCESFNNNAIGLVFGANFLQKQVLICDIQNIQTDLFVKLLTL